MWARSWPTARTACFRCAHQSESAFFRTGRAVNLQLFAHTQPSLGDIQRPALRTELSPVRQPPWTAPRNLGRSRSGAATRRKCLEEKWSRRESNPRPLECNSKRKCRGGQPQSKCVDGFRSQRRVSCRILYRFAMSTRTNLVQNSTAPRCRGHAPVPAHRLSPGIEPLASIVEYRGKQ